MPDSEQLRAVVDGQGMPDPRFTVSRAGGGDRLADVLHVQDTDESVTMDARELAAFTVQVPGRERPMLIMGHVHALSNHPGAGTPVTPFLTMSAAAVRAAGFGAAALVSVDWSARRVDALDLARGTSAPVYERAMPGVPKGVTWYVKPIETRAGQWVTPFESFAASGHKIELPAAVRAIVSEFRSDLPAGLVPAHTHSLTEERRRAK